ncbi:MAG: 50S ribosomal protein L21 [Pseudomonadota bacterium]
MFAVLKTGGKQYKVAPGDQLTIEKLAADAGETVQFNDILMLGGEKTTVGAPLIEGAAVQAEVLDQARGPKVISFVKRRRKHSSQRRRGHRQHLTIVKITEILASGGDKTGVKAAVGAASAAIVAAAAPAPKPKAAPKKKAEPKAEAPAPAAEEDAAPGTQPANLLTEAKGEADDLKKISGVGPKLEGTLNSIGVYHFWQIAEWGPDEIAFMDDKLSFKGRIERDDWIAQAKTFAAEAE